MDREYIEKHNIVERYRRDDLSDDELAQFEDFAIDKPDLLETLELDHLMSLGITEELRQITPFKSPPRPVWQLPMAASVLLMLGASIFFNIHLLNKSSDFENALEQQSSARGNIDVLTLAPLRSLGEEFRPAGTLKLKTDNPFAIITVQLSRPRGETFNVSIRDFSSGDTLFEIAGVEPRGAGDLTIAVPTDQLLVGDYVLEAGSPNDDPVAIQFRVAGEND